MVRLSYLLSLISGIGYFTLPYLVHAGAAHVYACEWNPNAVEALKRNLQLNGVAGESSMWTTTRRNGGKFALVIYQ